MGCFILRATRIFKELLEQWYVKEHLKLSLKKYFVRYVDQIKQYEVPLSRMLNVAWRYTMTTLPRSDFIPIRYLITELDLFPIMRGFHRTFTTGVTHWQQTLTPADTWFRPMWYMSAVWYKTFSPSLSLFSGLFIANIPRYFLDVTPYIRSPLSSMLFTNFRHVYLRNSREIGWRVSKKSCKFVS